MRILSIEASWVPPPIDVRADRFVILSDKLEGDVLKPIWFSKPEEVEQLFGPGTYPEYSRGKFLYHWFISFRDSGRFRRARAFWFYVRKGLELHRRKPYDCIVVYSHMAPALSAVILKWLTGAKLIVEIMTSPHLSYLYEHTRRTFGDRILRLYSDFCLHLSVLCSTRVHLLYPAQLDDYPVLRGVRKSVFFDFVNLSRIPADREETDRTILFVGAPWFLKGVDVLVEAFKRVASEFPDVKLVIQGHNPDQELQALAAGWPQIEISRPLPNPETLRRIARSLFLVLPSRCEGMGRVVLEAMGAGTPVIGSNAGGIPHYVRHGETGFVFPSGDAGELAMRLRELLSDPALRARMGRSGLEVARREFTEQAYVEQYSRMVEMAVRGDR